MIPAIFMLCIASVLCGVSYGLLGYPHPKMRGDLRHGALWWLENLIAWIVCPALPGAAGLWLIVKFVPMGNF